MKFNIKTRTKLLPNGEAMIQRRAWGLIPSFIMLVAPLIVLIVFKSKGGIISDTPAILLSLLPIVAVFIPPWRNWKLLDNSVYIVEGELNSLSMKIKGKLDEHREVVNLLSEKKKRIKSDKRLARGEVSEVNIISVNLLGLFFRKHPNLESPSKKFWLDLLNPKALKGDKNITSTVRDKMGLPAIDGSSRVAFVDAKVKDHTLALTENDLEGVDEVKFVDMRPKQETGSKKGNQSKNRQKGESDEDYASRMEAQSQNN